MQKGCSSTLQKAEIQIKLDCEHELMLGRKGVQSCMYRLQAVHKKKIAGLFTMVNAAVFDNSEVAKTLAARPQPTGAI